MIDRELLIDIGFERGTTGWDHEVWVYDGLFWVHFGDYDREQWLSKNHVNGDELDRREFMRLFLQGREDDIQESMTELTEDW